MKRALLIGAGVLWFALVFLVTFHMTFPSEAVAERVRYEVQEGSGGTLALEMRDVGPWWFGASADGIRLFKTGGAGPEEAPVLAFAADSARVRVGLGSLMRQAPRLSGAVQIGSSEIDYVVGTRMNQKGTALTLGELSIEAASFPLTELALLVGASMEGTGAVDVNVDIDAPESMRTASGSATIRGSDLLISKLDLASMGVPDLGMEIPVEDLDLTLEVRDGKATFTQGTVRSELVTIEIGGDITLRDDIERSTINLTLLLGGFGSQLEMFKPMLKSQLGEEWADGKFHLRCSGTLTRNSCRPDRERGAAPARTTSSGTVTTPRAVPTPGATSSSRGTAMDDDERARRREELRERLRQRREEMRGEVPTRTDEGQGEVVDEEYEEEFPDDEFEDEEFFEEELPPEEELIEEEF